MTKTILFVFVGVTGGAVCNPNSASPMCTTDKARRGLVDESPEQHQQIIPSGLHDIRCGRIIEQTDPLPVVATSEV